MELQKSAGKAGGNLDSFQVMHRVESAKDAIRKGLSQPVAKKDSGSPYKNIRKNADGTTVWVL